MKKLLLLIVLFITIAVFCSCGREGYEIKPHESAFLIPLTGDTTKQDSFKSEEFLNKNKLAAKRVVIEYEYIRGLGNVPEALLIKVNRTPVTREWTESTNNGTSKKNQGIIAESKESISFMARFNCTANILEEDSAKYLYTYPSNKKISEIMDNEIRAIVEGQFSEECSKLTMQEIIESKSKILAKVKEYAIKYFKNKGITIGVLSYKADFTYLDQQIQESINKKFKSANDLITQDNINKKVISQAKADREAIAIQVETIQKTLELKKLDNQSKAIEKWDGKLPQYSGSNGAIFNIPTN